MRKAYNEEKFLSDMKQKLENNILKTEKNLSELRMATDKKLEIEMGKTRKLGLEVMSLLSSVRNHFILLLNYQLSSNQRCMLEKITAKSIEWELDLNKSCKAGVAEWRSLDRTWLRIVSNMENVVEETFHHKIDNTAIINVLRDLILLESEISLHLEFILSGRSQHGDQDHKLAMRHIQEYEDRLNNAQGNRVYQRHVHKSKSFKVKSEENIKMNQRVKYGRSKTAELPSLNRSTEVANIGVKISKSDSSVKIAAEKLPANLNSECHNKRKSSFMNQVTHIFKNIL